MFEVGDKVRRIVTLEEWEDAPEILVVKGKDSGWISVEGHPMNGLSSFNGTKDWYYPFTSSFEEITQTEAELRGAKFGVMGVSKITGRKIRFVTDDGKKSLNGQTLWVFLNEETQSIMRLRPSEVRFEHEPEYVAWSEAPEHLRYDASRVYYDGEPVKWTDKAAPYHKGYEAGLRGDRYVNPYTNESQYSQWDAGYCAGDIDRKTRDTIDTTDAVS